MPSHAGVAIHSVLLVLLFPLLQLTAADSACPANQYRHFRVRITASNNAAWYDTSGQAQGRSAICATSWTAAQPSAAVLPSTASSVNISGVTSKSGNTTVNGPERAFQQLIPATCDYNGAWLVCL